MDTGNSKLTNNPSNSKSSRRNVKQRYNVKTDDPSFEEEVNLASPDIKRKQIVAIVSSPMDLMNAAFN